MGAAVLLDELTPDDVRRYLTGDDRIIIVSGAAENNGPHLPLGTDTFAATRLARDGSAATGVIVAPPIPFGISSVNGAFPGTTSLEPRTLSLIFENVCTSLAFHGFRRFVVIAGHYENAWPLAGSAETLRDRGLLVVQVDFWRLVEKHARDLAKTSLFGLGHGGEVMTSALLACMPELVHRNRMTTTIPEEGYALDYYRSYPEVMGFAAWDDVTATGSVGDPSQASAEAGEEVFRRLTAVLVKVLEDMRQAPLPTVRQLF